MRRISVFSPGVHHGVLLVALLLLLLLPASRRAFAEISELPTSAGVGSHEMLTHIQRSQELHQNAVSPSEQGTAAEQDDERPPVSDRELPKDTEEQQPERGEPAWRDELGDGDLPSLTRDRVSDPSHGAVPPDGELNIIPSPQLSPVPRAKDLNLTLLTESKLTSPLGFVYARLEGSGMAYNALVENGIRVVFDSRTDIGAYEPLLVPFSAQSSLEGGAHPEWCGSLALDCGFEGVSFDFAQQDRYYAVIEAVQESAENPDLFHSHVCRLDLGMRVQACTKLLDPVFPDDKAGVEGLAFVHYPDGETSTQFLFLLCEGGECGKRGKGRPGTVVVYAILDTDQYQYVGRFQLPSSAIWQDYSGIDVFGNSLLVISQEDSALWIGEFRVRDGDHFEVVGQGHVFYFPRRLDGSLLYCNVEGVAVLLPHPSTLSEPLISALDSLRNAQIGFASDKHKSAQGCGCSQKDQMVHVFGLRQQNNIVLD